MKIATFNVDWFRKNRLKIEEVFEKQKFDFLILTECVNNYKPKNYKYFYATKPIPKDKNFENLDYRFVDKDTYVRTAIYSNYKSLQQFNLVNNFTSICHKFETEIGEIVIYATIIGTWFTRSDYKKEFDNCKTDCLKIKKENDNLIIVGDLNTSFNGTNDVVLSNNTKNNIIDLCSSLKSDIITKKFEQNIDHIIIPENFSITNNINTNLIKGLEHLSKDHVGVFVEIK